MRNSKTSGMIKTVVAAAGLAMAMPAMAQFEGFSEIQSQVTGVAGVLQDLEGGDITGDGLNDMVFINETGSVWYFAGFDDGLFDDPPVRVVEPDDAGRAIELVDYDNDGDLDIVRVAAINAGDFRAYKNDGSGNFEFDFAITGIGNVNTRSGLEFGDFDGDGDRDLFVLVEDGVVIIENIGGDFSRSPIFSGLVNFTARGLAAGDLDGDGRAEAATISSSNDSVYITRSTGAGVVEIDRFSPGAGVEDIKLMDMDADGDLDLIVVNDGAPFSRVSVYRNNGSADFEFAYGLTVTDPEEVEVLDIDADGDIDVLVEAQTTRFDPEAIVVFLNDGDGNFDRQDDEWTFAEDFSISFEAIDLDPATGPDLVSVYGDRFGQRVSIRFNNTPFVEPTAPVLLTPANGTSNLALPSQVAAWGGPVAPAVTWERAEGFGVTYTVVVSESPALSRPVFEASGITARSADLSSADLRPATTYYWSVFADNPQGSTEAIGGPFSFTIASGGVACQADFDGDGELTLFDFLAFSSAFDLGCP